MIVRQKRRVCRWCFRLAVLFGVTSLTAGCGSNDGSDSSQGVPPTTDGGTDGGCGSPASIGTGDTWADLYRDYFGPTGMASCSLSPGQCHGASGDQGALPSGFVCGPTQASCYAGITASGSIVPAGGIADPTSTMLYATLRKAPPNAGGTMPLTPSCVAFTPADLQRIKAWIAGGAPNN